MISLFFFDCFLLFFQANFKLIPKDEVSQLPDDENTAEKRAEKLWTFFDKGENGEARHCKKRYATMRKTGNVKVFRQCPFNVSSQLWKKIFSVCIETKPKKSK